MPKQELQAPFFGVSDAMPFVKQPGDLTDPDGLLNIVPEDSATGRQRLSTREKALIEFAGAANSGKVQGISSIARASGFAGVDLTHTSRSTAGNQRPSTAIQGQCVALEADRSTRAVFADTHGTAALLHDPPTAGLNTGFGAFETCWHAADADIGYFATVAADTTAAPSSTLIVSVNRVSLVTNAITHQKYVVDGNAPYAPLTAGATYLLANQLLQFGPYLFVAVARYVYVFNADDLTYIKRHQIDWSDEVQAIDVVTLGTSDYLMVLATGNTAVAGPVTADAGLTPERYGEHYRTCILKHVISYGNATTKTAVAVASTVLTRQPMPMGIAVGGAGYEDHRSFRISEWSISRPRGRLAYAMVCEVSTDGDVFAYVATCSQGYNYDGTLTPGDNAPYLTCCRAVLTRAFLAGSPAYMSPAAPDQYGFDETMAGWERDSASLRRAFPWHGLTLQNDIPIIDQVNGGVRDPQVAGNEPSVWAVALDAARRQVYFAGRRSVLTTPNPTGVPQAPNVWCFDADTGDFVWAADVAGTVQQNAIAVDPVSGNLLVAMIRSRYWITQDGTVSGAFAEVLELSPVSGQTVGSFDMGDWINKNLYIPTDITSPTGYNQRDLGSYGVDVNSRGQMLVALAPYRYDI